MNCFLYKKISVRCSENIDIIVNIDISMHSFRQVTTTFCTYHSLSDIERTTTRYVLVHFQQPGLEEMVGKLGLA